MCGRYVMALRAGELSDALETCGLQGAGVVQEQQPWRLSWNVPPTSTVPILVERLEDPQDEASPRHREIHPARWGLLPHWAESDSFSSKTFNARSETVVTKPSFRSAVRRRRCVVPAQGYYEWELRTDESSGRSVRTPHHIHPTENPLMLFAGLYEWWKDPGRVAAGQDPWVLSTTILTGPSPRPDETGDPETDSGILTRLGNLHDRLPLAMDAQTARSWISPQEASKEAMESVVEHLRLQAWEVARGWAMYEVDRAVGNVSNDRPELIRPTQSLF